MWSWEDLSPIDKIKKARTIMLKYHPFFGQLAMYLQPKEVKEIKTMAVDPKGNLYYNPDYVNKLTFNELIAILMHEVLHLALQHLIRRGKRNEVIWNFACDMCVNRIIEEYAMNCELNVRPKLPERVVRCPDEFKDKNAEQIYAELKQRTIEIRIPICSGGKGGHGGKEDEGFEGMKPPSKGDLEGELERRFGERFDEHREGEGISEEERKKIEEEWKNRVSQAYHATKTQGKFPAGLEKLIDEALKPSKINWRLLLWRYISQSIPFDYTWTKPSRTSYALGYYLPSVKKDTLEIVVALDTSGSIRDEEYVEFLSEIVSIAKSYENVKITAILCDADVQKIVRDESSIRELLEEIRKRKGYGGTDFRPVFEFIEKEKRDCKLLIYFTDGFGTFPDKPPSYPVIWVITEEGISEEQVPFGLALKM